jgi:hypothetical protein
MTRDEYHEWVKAELQGMPESPRRRALEQALKLSRPADTEEDHEVDWTDYILHRAAREREKHREIDERYWTGDPRRGDGL